MITLPWVALCHDNHKHVPVRGRLILSAKYRMAKDNSTTLIAAQWKGVPMQGAVSVTVAFYEPDRRRRDVANYAKILGDSLTGIAFEDDSQIDEFRFLRKAMDRKNPRVEIEISLLANPL